MCAELAGVKLNNYQPKKVKSIKIADIEIRNNTRNLLVIDVQGFEYEVLKSINFSVA